MTGPIEQSSAHASEWPKQERLFSFDVFLDSAKILSHRQGQ